MIAQSTELVVEVGLVVLEYRATIVLLELSDRVAVGADFEVPSRRSPGVVVVAARLVPSTFEVPQSVFSPSG